MRLTSELWVKAYLRQCQVEGDFAALIKRGAEKGGAIFIIVNYLDGTSDLYGPAPQIYIKQEYDDRAFDCILEHQDVFQIDEKLEREKKFDPDLWIVERENNQGTHGLDYVVKTDD